MGEPNQCLNKVRVGKCPMNGFHGWIRLLTPWLLTPLRTLVVMMNFTRPMTELYPHSNALTHVPLNNVTFLRALLMNTFHGMACSQRRCTVWRLLFHCWSRWDN